MILKLTQLRKKPFNHSEVDNYDNLVKCFNLDRSTEFNSHVIVKLCGSFFLNKLLEGDKLYVPQVSVFKLLTKCG